MASTSPCVSPAAAIPGGGSKVVWAASVAGFSPVSPGGVGGDMMFSAASGARAFARAAVLGGGGALVLAVSGALFVARVAQRPSRSLACNAARST
jgi:hypothetical protein